MAETFYPNVKKPISLETFIKFIENNPIIEALKSSEYKPGYLETIAQKLAQLALNKTFLVKKLGSELKNFETFQTGNQFKPSTIIIHRSTNYVIRAVIWMPLSDRNQAKVFSYFEPHDHNFDFFTVNYFGPGYKTRIYQYDYDLVKGIPGEEINLPFIEECYLTQDKVMYYYGSSDAHIQYPPESITVSLNLILPKTYPAKRRQYEFELLEKNGKAKIILGNLDRLTQMRTLIDTAIKLGDKNSLVLIRKIAMTHSNEQMRAIAWKAILANYPDKSVLALALEDHSEYVKASLAEFIKD
ncbi:hypothetical protein [Legionella resiliens]|uniref:HEAT repeat domain-containing protein n=1 Tax=Legionella resiliens TaxID=2905958 RepID=A0ABS8X6G6_9GAMM|nr:MULTISPECIES: hypothetical protein [unclassified Legionella]MCE0724166.1 hypothetical protein [Legionella sp. 9fVS26]MCE3533319.1 hypothetical protein [Legionella sp. 8cVS16]